MVTIPLQIQVSVCWLPVHFGVQTAIIIDRTFNELRKDTNMVILTAEKGDLSSSYGQGGVHQQSTQTVKGRDI